MLQAASKLQSGFIKDVGKVALVSRSPGNHYRLYQTAEELAPAKLTLFEKLFPRPISGRWGTFAAAVILLDTMGQETPGPQFLSPAPATSEIRSQL